jgi:lysozyme family protein
MRSEAFERCFAIILRLEGVGVSKKNPDGYVNHPKDPGGETKFGICQKSYPKLNIKALTKEEALEIYWRDFWTPSGAERLAWPENCVHADAAVNQGLGMARRFLRTATDVESYFVARLDRYKYLASRSLQAAYWLPAWKNRLAALRKAIQ